MDLHNLKTKLQDGKMVQAFNLTIQEAEGGGNHWVGGNFELHNDFQAAKAHSKTLSQT